MDTAMPSQPTPKPKGKPRRRTAKLELIRRQTAQAVFLTEFAKCGNLTASAKVADINRDSIYAWLEHDEAFSLRYHQAEAEAADAIRAELHRRAVEGVERVVVSAGRVVMLDGKPLVQREYSDHLLGILAKARCPEYRESAQVEISGKVEISDARELLAAKLAALAGRVVEALPAGQPDA